MKISRPLLRYLVSFLAALVLIAVVGASDHQAHATPPTDGISKWSGNGDGSDSIGTNDGNVNGATFEAGLVGQAFSFTGVHADGQHVEIPYDASLASPFFSLSLFVKPRAQIDDSYNTELLFAQASGRAQMVVLPGETGGLDVLFQFRHSSGHINVESSLELPLGQWSHVTGTL